MLKFNLNGFIQAQQKRTLLVVISGLVAVLAFIIILLADSTPKKSMPTQEALDLTGIVDESFTEANTESALTSQQTELDALKAQVTQLSETLKTINQAHEKEVSTMAEQFQAQLKNVTTLKDEQPVEALQPVPEPQNPYSNAPFAEESPLQKRPGIHLLSFKPKSSFTATRLNPAYYVPSNTSVRAIILGGADADASVNGQAKNNGVMLFKLLEEGTLPNGKHSRLSGCRVSGNVYGDISSERAFATLYRLSCARRGEPIIDKEVTGWVFFNGKVGIKGQPLMRDNKVMQWAGVSGALSGIATAAQYAQSVQQMGSMGAASVVPAGSIAPYAGYGGASKAADVLSQYYVKRAEQYHPVIQIGAGNVVTIVFKEGFYLAPDEENTPSTTSSASHPLITDTSDEEPQDTSFNVPPEVLGRIDKANAYSKAVGGNP